jgi:two-component system response regulator YesN
VQPFEFQLLNALETFDAPKAAAALRDGWQALEHYFSFTAFVLEAVKVIDGFFARNGFEAYPWFDGQPELFLDLETLQLIVERRMRQLNRQPAYSDHIVEKAKEYIGRHLNRAVTLSEVAEVVRLNMTYFSEYFKDKTGENFTQYVSRVRIEEAKRLLLDPSVKIIEIAEGMGYQNPRYFSKSFKNIVGVTPKEYRERHHIYE